MSNAIQNTAGAVFTLAMNGARHILVANLPDLGLTPWGLDQGPAASATLTYLTGVYNLYRGSALDSLAANGIPTIRFDAAGLISEVAANPESFGLEDATHRALSTPGDDDAFLFWDDVHPTTAGHRIVADRVVQDLVAYYSPRRGRGKGPGLVNSLNGLTKVRR
jgi:outer membrane lipase/esterase